MLDRGLRRAFDPAVEHEARHADQTVEPGARRDLRSLTTFTIDPSTARDFDDAVSAERAPEGWRVWVHIADVSAFVAPGSIIDHEAYRRATSVYVPGAVEPMLPRGLSDNACSLVPGQDRLTVSVEMVIEDRQVKQSAFHRSVIRSDRRLDYDHVDRIFAGSEHAPEAWGQALASARAAASELAARRAERASIVVDSSEPEFSFDEAGNPVAARPVEQTESHRLIEHLMIAANEQVAALLESRRIPALYRVHERPDGEAAERLLEQLASLGVPTPAAARGHLTPQQAAEVVGEASQLAADWTAKRGHGRLALSRLVLRSVKQAYYDHRNLGHAGLQSERYCHFTSPIRRYPDLVCHRALLSAITGEVPAPQPSFVTAAGPWTSAREREAMMIERDADDIARCFLLERELRGMDGGHWFDGEVVGLVGSGAFIAFGEGAMFEGMLPVRRMRGDWWELNEEGTMLVGAHTGRAMRLGDPVQVRVASIDAPRGRVDLEADWEEG
jgi:ribonuclease R